MKKVNVRKLFLGCASIRSYIVDKELSKGNGITIVFNKRVMTVSYEKLNKKWQIHKREFKSKWGVLKYQLYDIPFIPDDMNRKIALLKNKHRRHDGNWNNA